MKPHETEYRRLKERAKQVAKDDAITKEVLREIASYVVGQLQALGLSEGALCAWAGITGFDAFEEEVKRFSGMGRYESVHQQMRLLCRLAGVAHEKAGMDLTSGWWSFSSEPMRRANVSVVWTLTDDFRATFEHDQQLKVDAARKAKMEKWIAETPPPRQVGPASIADILGKTREPNKAPEPTPGTVTPRAKE